MSDKPLRFTVLATLVVEGCETQREAESELAQFFWWMTHHGPEEYTRYIKNWRVVATNHRVGEDYYG